MPVLVLTTVVVLAPPSYTKTPAAAAIIITIITTATLIILAIALEPRFICWLEDSSTYLKIIPKIAQPQSSGPGLLGRN